MYPKLQGEYGAASGGDGDTEQWLVTKIIKKKLAAHMVKHDLVSEQQLDSCEL